MLSLSTFYLLTCELWWISGIPTFSYPTHKQVHLLLHWVNVTFHETPGRWWFLCKKTEALVRCIEHKFDNWGQDPLCHNVTTVYANIKLFRTWQAFKRPASSEPINTYLGDLISVISPSWCSKAPCSIFFLMSYSWMVSSLLPVTTNLTLAATEDMEAVWPWCVNSALAVHSCEVPTNIKQANKDKWSKEVT